MLGQRLKPCHFRVLDKKKYLWGTTGCEVSVPGDAGCSNQHPGRLRRLEHFPPSQQHAGYQPADPRSLCTTYTTHLCLLLLFACTCSGLPVCYNHLFDRFSMCVIKGERRGPEPGREVGLPGSSVTATFKTWGTGVQCPTAAYLQLPALCMYSTAVPYLSTPVYM